MMKKIISVMSCCFAFLLLFVFGGCSTVKDPEVWESPDNPEIMVFDGVIPKPDSISIHKGGKGKQLEADTEEFDAFWQVVSDLLNGNGEGEGIDSSYDFEQIEECKQIKTCFEFLYDKIHVKKDTTRRFKGLFFVYEGSWLVYGYYTVDENGEWKYTDENGYVTFSAFFAVTKSKYKQKVNRISDLIVVD